MSSPHKREIIKDVLSKLNKETSEIAIASASWTWFKDGRTFSNGLRLYPPGYNDFVKAGYKFYRIQLNKPLDSLSWPAKFFLGLQDRFKFPWYLENECIFISNESEAAWVMLLGGDLTLLK